MDLGSAPQPGGIRVAGVVQRLEPPVGGSRMGFMDKKVAQSVMLVLSNEHGMEIDMKGRNDLRNWDSVRDFAHRFAESLKQ